MGRSYVIVMYRLLLQLGIEFTQTSITLAGAIAVFVLIALSGFFSSAEIALFSLPEYRIEAMVDQNLSGAQLVKELKDDPHRLLVTILVGNNIVNIAMASVSTTLLALYLPPAQSVLVATFGITALVLLFGESAPKSYAVAHSESWSRRIARPIKLSEYLMYPLIVVFDVLTRLVNRLTGSGSTLETPYVTRNELRQLIELGESEGVLETQERELLMGVFQFRNRIVKEVMQSRLDTVAIDATASVTAAIDACLEADRDRLPVFRETLDDVIGIVELTDLVRAFRVDPEQPVDVAATPVLHVPETKDIDELLVEMRDDRRRMAIVVDEFGTTQGLVTLDDILEEIVGELLQGTDRPGIETIDDDKVRVRGTVNIHELNETLGVTIPEGEEFETIAGFVYAHLGRVPEEGETLRHEDIRITVERMDRIRIRSLLITLPSGSLTGSSSSP